MNSILSDLRKRTDDLIHRRRSLRQSLKGEKKNLRSIEKYLSHLEEARSIIQEVAQEIQRQAHQQIAGVVTHCLQTVFGPEYGFTIEFTQKRGRTEAELLLLKGDNVVLDPMNDDSGGVVDIASLALRLSCLTLSKPKLRKLLVLDQPFTNVSEDYQERVCELMEGLSRDFGVQFINVNHVPAYRVGRIITL